MDDEAIQLRPVGRKGLTSLRLIFGAMIFLAAFHVCALGLTGYALMGAPPSKTQALYFVGAWEIVWLGLMVWGVILTSKEITETEPGWVRR